jgi:hypothetical protein
MNKNLILLIFIVFCYITYAMLFTPTNATNDQYTDTGDLIKKINSRSNNVDIY